PIVPHAALPITLFLHDALPISGPFVDALRKLDDPGTQEILKTSSGVHVVLPARFSPPDTGLLIPKTEDGRVLFLLPWLGRTLVGDRKSTRLNSSHVKISYAVFC